MRTYCIAQGTLFNTLYSILNTPIWEKNLKKSGYVCVCVCITDYIYNQ